MENENSTKQEVDPNFAEFLKVEMGEQNSTNDSTNTGHDDDYQEPNKNSQDDDFDGDNFNDDNQDDDSDNSGDTKNPDQTITMLQEQISNLTSLVTGLVGKKDESPSVDDEPEVSIFESEKFNALAEGMRWDDEEKNLMKSFLSDALESNSKRTLKAAMNDIPELVNSSVTATQSHAEMRKSFFSDNVALKPVAKYVSEIASSIAAEYKSAGKKASIPEILNEAAKRSYENLGIKKVGKQSKGESRSGNPSPAFPKNRSNSRKTTPKTTKMQNDIAAIMALDN